MLSGRRTEVGEERSTRQALAPGEVEALLAAVDEVWIARGKKLERRPARAVGVDDLRGPTGNIRAPLVRFGRRLLVGFHAETLAGWLGS